MAWGRKVLSPKMGQHQSAREAIMGASKQRGCEHGSSSAAAIMHATWAARTNLSNGANCSAVAQAGHACMRFSSRPCLLMWNCSKAHLPSMHLMVETHLAVGVLKGLAVYHHYIVGNRLAWASIG